MKRRLKTYFIRVSWKCIANTEMEVGDGAGGGGGGGRCVRWTRRCDTHI